MILAAIVTHAAGVAAHVPGRILARYRRSADSRSLEQTLRVHRAVVREQVPELGLAILDVPEESGEAIIDSLGRTGLFEYVERDYYARAGATPNDPSFSSQWHLAKIQAPRAWNLTTGSAAVIVAVIDSGVDSTHPDLATKLVNGWNFVAGTPNTTDLLGHGTAVAGAVAAATNNGVGVAGVSWGSLIMPLVVVDSNDYAAYSNIALAIQYAADHGARVINVSIGGSNSSLTLQSAVDYAWNAGATVFAAAMNYASPSPYYPAACKHVVAVSATDNNDQPASWSDYGNWITISAPGTDIFTTSMGGNYGYWAGTSFASPIAAGVAALALAANPSLTNFALVTLLEQNADDLGATGYDPSFGWGRVNAYRAVSAALEFATPLPGTVSMSPPSASLTGGQSQQFTAAASGTSNTAVTWSLSPAVGNIAGGLYTAPASIGTNQTVTVTATAPTGASASATVTLTAPAAQLRLHVDPGERRRAGGH